MEYTEMVELLGEWPELKEKLEGESGKEVCAALKAYIVVFREAIKAGNEYEKVEEVFVNKMYSLDTSVVLGKEYWETFHRLRKEYESRQCEEDESYQELKKMVEC
jgi:hypothetical protein